LSNETSREICLYIEPYAHVNIKKNDILLYNTLNGEQLVYRNRADIAKLLERMISKKNLNAFIKNIDILEDEGVAAFLKESRHIGAINWYDYFKENKNHKKPVSIPALLNLHRDRKKMILDPERSLGEDIKKYLHKINIYINCYKRSDHGGPLFIGGYKQFLFPYSPGKHIELKVHRIQKLLDQIKGAGTFLITILGGNIFEYGEIDDLIGCLDELPVKKELGVFYRDINEDRLRSIDWKKSKEMSLRVFVEPQFGHKELVTCVELMERFKIDANYQFVVESERDVERLDEIIDFPDGGKFSIKPFYNGNNYRFFKQNVFIETSDLSDPPVKNTDIYARSVMNSNHFGEITILGNGDIYSNINERRIGTIDQEIQEVLLKELREGKGWFRVRRDQMPCKGCVYNQICPPISNYEYALSRNDLCMIRPGNVSTGVIDDR